MLTSTTQSRVSAPLYLRVSAVHQLATDIKGYELTSPSGQPLPTVMPGAHIGLHLPNGSVRQYSLVEAAEQPARYRIAVKRESNSSGGSIYIHDALEVGMGLWVDPPRNHFPLDERAEHSVLIAGGIGITALHCMAERIAALGKSWHLYYSCRDRSGAAFLDLQERYPGNVTVRVTNAGDQPFDVKELVNAAVAGSHFYCCGPVPMLQAFEAATAHLPPSQVHLEYFQAKAAAATEGGYEVELRRSGKTFWIPHGKTILAVLQHAGQTVPASCRQGICGACETEVIAGTPDHRDAVLSDAERASGRSMMICCSGSKSNKLVLDL
jgi:ferredoxin-NADP reductase